MNNVSKDDLRKQLLFALRELSDEDKEIDQDETMQDSQDLFYL